MIYTCIGNYIIVNYTGVIIQKLNQNGFSGEICYVLFIQSLV